MRTSRSSRPVAVAAVVGALVAAGAGTTASYAAPKHEHIARSVPTWVQHATSLGRATGASTFRVSLAPRGGVEALKAFDARVSDPKSPQYRHFLTARQYHRRFDASPADVAKVRRWLTGQHLSVLGTDAHHRFLTVRGDNTAIGEAFGTTIRRYRHRGHLVQANATALSVPAGLSPLVTTVTGLDTTPRLVEHAARKPFPPSGGFRNARPCSSYYGEKQATAKADGTPLPPFQGKYQPYAPCGYTGKQLRSAYEQNSTLTGRKVTVAITDAYASPTIASDANTYAVKHGDGAYQPGQLLQRTPRKYAKQKACDASGWYGEETLDVEAVHAMAPDATILYYASASCSDPDFLTALRRVVDENQASLVSNSWSDLEANESPSSVADYEQVFMQGAAQGIGFMFSSGDDGDEQAATGTKQVDYPASDPYATAVGGTSDAIGADGQFLFQTGWGTDKYSLSADGQSWEDQGFLYGAGGGPSKLFAKPDYQQGVVPAGYTTRAVPDVGLTADPNTGMLVGQTQQFSDGTYYDEYRIGGTSLASPLFAGMTALREQQQGGRLGFLNPAIYRNGSTAFRDVTGAAPDRGVVRADYVNGENAADGTTYSVRTFNDDSSLKATPGWDDVTGVGSPDPGWFAVPPGR